MKHSNDCKRSCVVDTKGTILMEQAVEANDIFRMCQVKDTPIQVG
jgi:isocitrate dehydrogenase